MPPNGPVVGKPPESASSHTMELPRLIVIGEKNIGGIGGFVRSLGRTGRMALISGVNVRKLVQDRVERSLEDCGIRYDWHLAPSNEVGALKILEDQVRRRHSRLIAGIGGGQAVDAAKMLAFNLKVPFVSVPTAASHDGVASPFVSLKGDRPHSMVATAPLGVFVDIDIIKGAPRRLLSSGCGDLIANVIAVSDWELGRDRTGEYYGRYSASLAMLSAGIVLENAAKFAKSGIDARVVVEALISAGVASCIAGSSRPCSGAEHLFSHALDKIAPEVGLHGEKCGIGAIMMAKLHGRDWKKISQALRDVGAPTTAEQIGLDRDTLASALVMAQDMRPERYTILKEKKMTKSKAISLAESTLVL